MICHVCHIESEMIDVRPGSEPPHNRSRFAINVHAIVLDWVLRRKGTRAPILRGTEPFFIYGDSRKGVPPFKMVATSGFNSSLYNYRSYPNRTKRIRETHH